jgi:hypothetical protein
MYFLLFLNPFLNPFFTIYFYKYTNFCRHKGKHFYIISKLHPIDILHYCASNAAERKKIEEEHEAWRVFMLVQENNTEKLRKQAKSLVEKNAVIAEKETVIAEKEALIARLNALEKPKDTE